MVQQLTEEKVSLKSCIQKTDYYTGNFRSTKGISLEVIQRKPFEVDSLSLEVITSPTKGRNINSLNFACHKSMFRIINWMHLGKKKKKGNLIADNETWVWEVM